MIFEVTLSQALGLFILGAIFYWAISKVRTGSEPRTITDVGLPVDEAYDWAKDILVEDAADPDSTWEAELNWKEAIKRPSVVPLILLRMSDLYRPEEDSLDGECRQSYGVFLSSIEENNPDDLLLSIRQMVDEYIRWVEQVTPAPWIRSVGADGLGAKLFKEELRILKSNKPNIRRISCGNHGVVDLLRDGKSADDAVQSLYDAMWDVEHASSDSSFSYRLKRLNEFLPAAVIELENFRQARLKYPTESNCNEAMDLDAEIESAEEIVSDAQSLVQNPSETHRRWTNDEALRESFRPD